LQVITPLRNEKWDISSIFEREQMNTMQRAPLLRLFCGN